MKYVNIERMNPIVLACFFITCLIACGTRRPVLAKSVSDMDIMSNPFTIQPDTVKGNRTAYLQPDTAKIRRILLKPVQPMIDARTPSYDTLMKYNFKWQQSYLRLVDSNIKRRVQRDAFKQSKDSALIVAKETRSIVKAMQSKQSPSQSVGDSVIQLSNTVADYIIYYIALIGTIHIVLSFWRKKQIA